MEAGIFRGEVHVKCDGYKAVDKIEVSATSVEYFTFMTNIKGEQI